MSRPVHNSELVQSFSGQIRVQLDVLLQVRPNWSGAGLGPLTSPQPLPVRSFLFPLQRFNALLWSLTS